MINGVTMKILADDYILRALQEDVTSEKYATDKCSYAHAKTRQSAVDL